MSRDYSLYLEVIGEAVKHIPDDLRARYPDVDWKRIAGLRDIIGKRAVSPKR